VTAEAAGGRDGRWRVRHAVAAFGAGLAASIPATAAVWRGGVTPFEAFAVVGAVQTLATIGVVALLRRRPGREPLGLRPASSDLLAPFLGVFLAVAASWATYVVLQLLGIEAPSQSVVRVAEGAVGWGTRAAVVIVAVLLAPVAEELVFRGILLRALRHRFSAGWSGLISALAFALAHLALDPDAVAAVPALFVVGLVLAAMVRATGRLSFAVGVHFGFNLAGVLALLLA